MEEVRTIGRLVYIEPNNIRSELGGIRYGNGDNIAWRPEDLNISVDLQVIIPDRDSCGQTDIGDNFIVNISSADGTSREWQSFFGGTELKDKEKSLTTEYTDISYQEIRNNKAGGKENLGIQSIDIQFDSHFFPIVKMKITDVRGYSLMQPAEMQYKSDLEARKNKEVPNKACEQFFSALFHFPYPRFALSIKGFYGNRVTFMLAVNDFQSSFNSQTGNFDVEISFIGHMYGFYADLPLTALLVAPYIGSTNGGVNDYWSSQVGNGIFTFSDGTEIPTIKDFILMYEKMDEKFKELQANDGNKFEKLTKVDNLRIEREHLNKLSNEYKKIFYNIGRDADGKSYVTTQSEGNIILYFTDAKELNPSSYESMSMAYNAYKDFMVKNNENATIIAEPKNAVWNSKIPTKKPLYERLIDGSLLLDTQHEYYERLDETKDEKGSSILNKLTDTQKRKNLVLIEKDLEFEHNINERISEIENETTALIKESTDEIQEVTKNILGVNPTIENIIRMIFAHIDAFMHAFYEVLGNIDAKKKNGERLLKNIRGLSLDSTNIEAKGTENCFIPPFTTYYTTDQKTNERVKAYSDRISAISALDEVKFVDSICEAIDAVNENIEKSRNTDTVATITDTWEKLSVLDVLEYGNPYRKFNQNTPANSYVNELAKFVDSRFNNAMLNYTELTTEKINSEIENFWKINGSDLVTRTSRNAKIIEDLEKITVKTIEKIVGNDKTEYTGNAPGFYFLDETNSTDGLSDDAMKYNWDYKVNNNFLGNIYPEVVLTEQESEETPQKVYAREDKYGETIVAESRIYESEFYFPIVPIYGKKGIQNYFKYIKDNGNEKKDDNAIADELISCLVGTDNVFRFTKNISNKIQKSYNYNILSNGGVIVRMPKNIALFLGCAIANQSFKIAEDGLFYYDGTPAKKLKEDNITIERLTKLDAGETLKNFYLEWQKGEGKNIVYSGKTWADSISESAETKSVLFGEKITITPITRERANELTSALIQLTNTMVDILLINPYSNGDRHNDLTMSFLKGVLERMKNERQDDSDNSNSDIALSTGKSGFSRELIKEQMYYTLADLYDKWLAGYSEERFKLKSPSEDEAITKDKLNGAPNSKGKHITEIENFMYIDTFYNNIGQIFLVDPKTVVDAFLRNNGETYTSALQAISDIAFNNKLLFIPLPVFTNLYSGKDIASIFTPQGLYGKNEFSFRDMSRGIGSTYILMYTHEPSKHSFTGKDVGNTTTYSRDYLDLADTTGNINAIDIQDLNKTENGIGYTIPAFGVTFAKQNQMYFKNINVSMANPRQTDVAIQNTLNLADMEKRGNTRNAAVTIGQDLFSIYSNRAYDCTVEMMGCMDIVPTMYFQLNNIPLFKGAYRVVSVKHHIENGAMTTTFSGTRINKNAIPFNNNVIDIEGLYTKLKEKRADDNESSIIAGGQNVSETTFTVKYVPGYWSESENYPIFNIQDAINRLNKPITFYNGKTVIPAVNTKSEHYCVSAVKEAVIFGLMGDNSRAKGPWGDGPACAAKLEDIGFRCFVTGTTRAELISAGANVAKAGDIAVMKSRKSNWGGHVCIYNGTNWISDFIQKGEGGPCVYSEIKGWGIFRYQGRVIAPLEDVNVSISSNVDYYIGSTDNIYEAGEKYDAKIKRTTGDTTFKFEFFTAVKSKCTAYTFEDDENKATKVKVNRTKNYNYSIEDSYNGADNKKILKNLVIKIEEKK